METIGSQKIWTFQGSTGRIKPSTCGAIRKEAACPVRSYMELATKVADLQFHNRDFVLMFRGQTGDYRNKSGYSSLKPSLLRADAPNRIPSDGTLLERFAGLAAAEKALVAEYVARKYIGRQRLARQRILRWAILQHYEVCATPLLDVTQSLRIAASFATHRAKDKAYVFVLGVPQVSGAITASAEAGIQIVRLASVCPPEAVRPHIQEGYLLGEYPEVSSAEQKLLYEHAEMDFGRKLIAKFQFDPRTFWKESGQFPLVREKALYPAAADDPMLGLVHAVKATLGAG
ncbi:FRG domain-containing protein [Achromobacter aloeverae]|uniref:FRG domain-containing protein n=1 Tax=Achromobacter aloeverae TaxID=1750518 RepID=A0A4Q1HMK8_9BURK|nr:FRG domain-containing protein [Achromobacter aloeverae]RXN92212.1 hypothetical protein C7R54_00110 [Achromobacter aloeverae]